MTLQDAQACPARQPAVGDGSVAAAHTDTRSLQAGDLFVALRGERFDAADFLPQAQAAGAVAAIAERGLAAWRAYRACLCRMPASPWAANSPPWRRQHCIPLIAVTGSTARPP